MLRYFVSVAVLLFVLSCANDEGVDLPVPEQMPLEVPGLFAENIIPPIIPEDNPQTAQGVALGEMLFFDTQLSEDNSVSCASCHKPQEAFADTRQFSAGVAGSIGERNAMPLFNLAWNYDEVYLWDGSAVSLEDQVFGPVTNPKEMGNTWATVVARLQDDSEYPALFQAAFGTSRIDSVLVAKAIAQYERTLVSASSKFDKYLLGEVQLTPQELNGFNIFMQEERGDCFHCHGSDKNPLWTDNAFHNNGLDTAFTDLGLGAITGDPADNGKFRSPSLRNLAYTAPYMHDGRFNTLDEVINHYSEGLQPSSTIDPLMKKVAQGGVGLSATDKADLKAFLLTLSDPAFVGGEN